MADAPQSAEGLLAQGDEEAFIACRRARHAAVQAYCARVCEVDAIPAAQEAAFKSFEASLPRELPLDWDLDTVLLHATREAAAERATIAPSSLGSPAWPGAPRLVGASQPTAACEVMPTLLAAHLSDLLSEADLEKIARHLASCSRCQATEGRFEDAEEAFADRVAQRPLDEVRQAVLSSVTGAALEGDPGIADEASAEPTLDGDQVEPPIVDEESAPQGDGPDQADVATSATEPPPRLDEERRVRGGDEPAEHGAAAEDPVETQSRDDSGNDDPVETQPLDDLTEADPVETQAADGRAEADPVETQAAEGRADQEDVTEARPPAGGPAARGSRASSRGRWIVLWALVGLALAGGAAALLIGLRGDPQPPARVSPPTSGQDRPSGGERREPVDPRSVSVAVLSASPTPGIAARTGRRLAEQKFDVSTVGNAAGPVDSSIVLHPSGSAREAKAVGRKLEISKLGPLDSENRALAGSAAVVVIVGPDLSAR